MNLTKEQLFFWDCEWVPVSETLLDLQMDHPLLYNAFLHQTNKWNSESIKTPEEWWVEKAHFYPEFCKIICVSYGNFKDGKFEINSVYGKEEKMVLFRLPLLFDKVEAVGYTLCGYAIKRFDMPWLCKRMMANGIKPPKSLFHYGKKPWDINVFDLPEVWGQGNMQESFTPFELACAAIGFEGSKGELDGSKVAEAYWNGELTKIKEYCEKDVQKTMELATKLLELIP